MRWVKWVLENGAGGKRTRVAGWFMALDLAEWAGGRTAKCHKKDGRVG